MAVVVHDFDPIAPMRFLLLALVAAFAAPVHGQSTLQYGSVAAALKDLEAKDGNGTIVTHVDGWTIINEPPIAQWSFTPAGHAAHPAVVRRIIKRTPDGNVTVDTASLCEAGQDACTKLLADFAALNERITQTARARGRPTPMLPPQ